MPDINNLKPYACSIITKAAELSKTGVIGQIAGVAVGGYSFLRALGLIGGKAAAKAGVGAAAKAGIGKGLNAMFYTGMGTSMLKGNKASLPKPNFTHRASQVNSFNRNKRF